MAKRWTKKEVRALLDGLGVYGVAWLRSRTCPRYRWPGAPVHRSVNGIYAKIRRTFGPGGLTRGVFTLRQILLYSGYSRSHILRAQRACRQKWKRTGPKGSHLITDEQCEELYAWLGHDYWSKSKRLYACVWCTGDRQRSYALGLCVRCYHRYRRMCSDLGLPITIQGQVELVQTLAISADQIEILDRLELRIALQPDQLEWIMMELEPVPVRGQEREVGNAK